MILEKFNQSRYCIDAKIKDETTLIYMTDLPTAEGEFYDCITNNVLPLFIDDSKIFELDFFGNTTDSIIKILKDEGILSESTCNGNFSSWYYLTLLISHVYFLVDYILRLIS